MQPVTISRYLILLFTVFVKLSQAQDTLKIDEKKNAAQEKDFTISYFVALKSNKNSTGIGETYNGGIKTVFISGNKVRVRLISLMRTESVFLFPRITSDKIAAITKESGKNKYKYFLNKKEWTDFNSKYDSLTCQFTYDSAVIFNYPCRKAIITLKDGRSVGVYYTDSLKRKNFSLAEPLFSCIPGVVLQYEYRYKKGSVIYTATSVSDAKIDPAVFRIPAKGIVTRKFSMKPLSGNSAELTTEEEENEAGSQDQ